AWCALACSRQAPNPAPTPPPSASASISAAAPALSGRAPDDSPLVYTGSYRTVPGTLYVPSGPEWSGVKWRGEAASVGLGDGALSLRIAKTGRVEGSLEGAVGPARITGSWVDGTLTGTLSRKDPSDEGFTGTMVGKTVGQSATPAPREAGAGTLGPMPDKIEG